MLEHGGDFGFSVVEVRPDSQQATVIIGKDYVHALYNEAVQSRQKLTKIPGFSQGQTSAHYIEKNYLSHILKHLKEVLFSHCVVHLLYDSLDKKKVVVIGDPDLINIKLKPDEKAEFTFQLSNASFDREQHWKLLKFKPCRRKNYKDLDRQVEQFIEEEQRLMKKKAGSETIESGDWINFEVSLLNENKDDLIPGYTSDLWVRLAPGEDDRELLELFVGKKAGDVFLSSSPFLQDSISDASDITYVFQVKIKHLLQGTYFSLEQFSSHFQLETPIDLHNKLVEVFSTRNDITLRRETIEAAFKLLHKQYKIKVPPHLLALQEQVVLTAIQASPNYTVYKGRSDFYKMVKSLAEKQLKEAIIMDTIAYQEGISVDVTDICGYLNLHKRPRTKDFIYFPMPASRAQGHESAVPTALLKKYCLREKALNYVLRELQKPPKK